MLDVVREDDDFLPLGDVGADPHGEPRQRVRPVVAHEDGAAAPPPAFSISRPSLIVRTMSFDSSRYQLPSSNSIAGYSVCPVFSIIAVRAFRDGHGPRSTS